VSDAKSLIRVDARNREIPFTVSELRQVAALHTMDLYHRNLMVWAARTMDALTAALKAQRRGSCFCEMGIDNPMVKHHSTACQQAFEALAKAEGPETEPA